MYSQEIEDWKICWSFSINLNLNDGILKWLHHLHHNTLNFQINAVNFGEYSVLAECEE